MAELIELRDLRGGYVELVRAVAQHGRHTSPRGQDTLEIQDCTFTVDDLTQTLPYGVGRKINPAIAALEAVQLIAGRARSDLLCAVAPQFESFNEPHREHHYGAYGARIGVQFSQVVHKLRLDPDSRQAIITLWNPALDNESGHLDYPCTLTLGFRLREGKLNLSVTMRSNDVWLGTAYDVFQFTQLQFSVAKALGVDVGTYTHTAWSLHVYERDLDRIRDLRYPEIDGEWDLPHGLDSHYARYILRGNGSTAPVASTPDEKWYRHYVMTAHAKLNQRELP